MLYSINCLISYPQHHFLDKILLTKMSQTDSIAKSEVSMEYGKLGRTKLDVSVAGLGSGGHSRLGMFSKGLDNAANLVRYAYDHEVNFFDSSYAYGTHPALAKGLAGIDRSTYVLSSKFPLFTENESLRPAKELETILDKSLDELNTDYIDVFHLHGVENDIYQEARDRFFPELLKMQEKGKIRFLGITERFAMDTSHKMLNQAIKDDLWDVIMVGFNMLNPSASKTVFPSAIEKNIGTLCMFAVRSALSDPQNLALVLLKLIESGQVDKNLILEEGSLDFLVKKGHASTIMEAAYRYCRHTKGMDVILTGTSTLTHLSENLKSIQMPPLEVEDLEMLDMLFGKVDCVSGEK